MATFVRQLGSEPGVQLNPLRDMSEIPASGNADQSFAIVMRSTRGRIDKPFRVDRGTLKRKLGAGEAVRKSALNEAWVQVAEALNNGAHEAVVQRLVTPAAAIKWAVVAPMATTEGLVFSVADDCPEAGFLLAVQHLECFNDGIVLEVHADEETVGGVKVAQTLLSLRIRDPERNVLFSVTGSLDAEARDSYGASLYLPDVVAAQTDALVVVVGDVPSLAPTSLAYGYNLLGREQWLSSNQPLVCFVEGGTAYTVADYQAACSKLRNSNHEYGYLASGGSRAPALLAALAQLAFDTNTQLRYDIPGDLTVEAAIAFAEQLNMGASETAHLLHGFWSPLKSDDPTGINPRGVFGVAALNIAYACRRNSSKNAKGFAPKNYPIAGREWPIRRTGISQLIYPTGQELSRLAKAKIIPLFQTYPFLLIANQK